MMDEATFSAALEPSHNKLWGSHFGVPDEVAAAFLATGNQRVVCTVNAVYTWQCALVAYAKGRRVITLNKQTKEKLGLAFGDTATLRIVPDTSEYGLPVPEEFEALLSQDPDGGRLFQALTDGRKRTLLYLLAKPKTSDLRIRTAITVLNHLKMNRGRIDYKALDLALRADG